MKPLNAPAARFLILLALMGTLLCAGWSTGAAQSETPPAPTPDTPPSDLAIRDLAEEVRSETLRTWRDYQTYAWGYDVLKPISRQGYNWYSETLGISPFDAYSTLKVMGFDEEAAEIETYALTMNWDKDVYVQVFEVNIRILGGLLSMYHFTDNPEILDQARDFADRLLPAFATPTGLPHHSVNLRTGQTGGNHGEGPGDVVNVAQAATYLFEFGILSYFTGEPVYYQTAKKATQAIFARRSELGLPGENINVISGKWVGERWSHLQACIDSYYEYMFKSQLLFPDPEIRAMWDESIAVIESQLREDWEGQTYYTIVDMDTGAVTKRSVSLYDAFFPAIQALSGDLAGAARTQRTWFHVWNRFHLLPSRYRYDLDATEYAGWDLNPEIIESAYYLHQLTGEAEYLDMLRQFWADIRTCCRHEVGYHAIANVNTMEPKDYMHTYFIAETLKYFYLAFGGSEVFEFDDHVFNTEAHPFRKAAFDPKLARERLGY